MLAAVKELGQTNYRAQYIHTLPSDASSSLTGHSRTEATKQNDAGSPQVAAGYHAKSRMGAGWGNHSFPELLQCGNDWGNNSEGLKLSVVFSERHSNYVYLRTISTYEGSLIHIVPVRLIRLDTYLYISKLNTD